MADEITSVMIVGVGGQGTVLAGKLLGKLLVAEGFDVKGAEVHGMSQRGGSVVTYVRFGQRVYSPLIDKGGADFIAAFEMLEAARHIEWLKATGKIVANTQQIDPMSVLSGQECYPANIAQAIRAAGADLVTLDCLSLAKEAGSAKAVNLVLLGCLSRFFDIPETSWLAAIEDTVPAKFLELNRRAFALGRQTAGQ